MSEVKIYRVHSHAASCREHQNGGALGWRALGWWRAVVLHAGHRERQYMEWVVMHRMSVPVPCARQRNRGRNLATLWHALDIATG